MTYYLKFPNKKTAKQLLEKAGFLDEDKNIISCTHDYAIDVVGVITEGGEYDEEGNVITQPITLSGWHINYVGELPSDWKQYLVSPEEPVRVFFDN
jgi:hypothetical protein